MAMAFECVIPACDFIPPPAVENAAALQAIIDHMAIVHPAQIPRTCDPAVWPPALSRPTVDLGCTPAQWSVFLQQWSRFSIRCNITDVQMTTQCTACFSDELVNTADKAITNMGTLTIRELLAQVKSIAVQLVAVGILRAAAHSAKQVAGERFQAFATKVRNLVTDCNYVDPCPHMPPPVAGAVQALACAIVGCVGADYTAAIVKNVLLSGIYDHDVHREVLGTVGVRVRSGSVQHIINLVELKEAARDAASGARPAAAAASTSSYKKERKDATAKPSPRKSPPPCVDRQPRSLRCRCGNDFDDYALRRNGGYNPQAYEQCRACYLRSHPNAGA